MANALPCGAAPGYRVARAVVVAAAALAALLSAGGLLAAPRFFSERVIAAYSQRYGEEARQRLFAWRDVIEQTRKSNGDRQRRAANAFWNRIPWLTDQQHWGALDYWATPLEMLGTDGGDCEDYSIAKYFSLAAMDVPTERLIITYVRATTLTKAHMVLAYYEYPHSDPLILDNLVQEIRLGSQRSDLIPVYSFNGHGLWLAVERGRGRRIGSAITLRPWRDLLKRMAAQAS